MDNDDAVRFDNRTTDYILDMGDRLHRPASIIMKLLTNIDAELSLYLGRTALVSEMAR